VTSHCDAKTTMRKHVAINSINIVVTKNLYFNIIVLLTVCSLHFLEKYSEKQTFLESIKFNSMSTITATSNSNGSISFVYG
jgi:hypothetical protein